MSGYKQAVTPNLFDPITGAWVGVRGINGDEQLAAASGSAISNVRGLRRFRTKLQTALYQVIRVAVHGDSLCMGAWSDDASGSPTDAVGDVNGYVGRLRTRLANLFNTTEAGYMYAGDARVTGVGTSLSLSVGPAVTSGGTTTGGACSLGVGNTLSFPLPACTGYSILYMDSNASGAGNTGTFSYKVDAGGTTTTTADNTLADNPKRINVTGLANTTHTVLITGVTGTCYIMGVEYYGNNGVIVQRLGLSGGDILDKFGNGAQLNVNAAGQARVTNHEWHFMAPGGLHIIALGHNAYMRQNDATYPVTPSTFKTYLQSAISTIVADGGCVLLVGEPKSNVTGPLAGQETYPIESYWGVLDSIAATTDHVACIQINQYFGNFANSVALGNQSASSGVHPLKQGHADMAGQIMAVLNGLMQTAL